MGRDVELNGETEVGTCTNESIYLFIHMDLSQNTQIMAGSDEMAWQCTPFHTANLIHLLYKSVKASRMVTRMSKIQ